MKLEYDVIAIDDDANSAQTFREGAAAFLSDEGFVLRWETLRTPDEVKPYLGGNLTRRPDLVLVDDRLGEQFDGKDGDHWAATLRNRFGSTDIVFYGAESADVLRTKMASAKVDGVFCSTRRELSSRLRDIIGVHIYRWTDPEAMRGLAVGIATDLDELMRTICLAVAEKKDDQARKKFYARILKKSRDTAKYRPRDFEALIEKNDTEALLRHPMFGAINLLDAVRYLAEDGGGDLPAKGKEFAKRYKAEVIEKRNVLAHGKYDETTRAFSLGKLPPFERTPDNCRAFRTSIGHHREVLQALAAYAAEHGQLEFAASD